MYFITENGTINEQFVELCNQYGVSVTTTTPFWEVNQLLQEKWRQKQLLHAYQITGQPPSTADMDLLKQLDCVDTIFPPDHKQDQDWGPMEFGDIKMQKAYLVMGALRSTVVRRLYQAQIWAKDYPIPYLFYLMGGARTLDPKKESEIVLCEPGLLPFRPDWQKPRGILAVTEAQMMQMVWEQSQIPDQWHAQLVNAPMQPKNPTEPDGEKCPPKTGDTVREWLLNGDRPGYYLVGSNQPYVRYQQLVVERIHEELLDQGLIKFPCYFKGCGSSTNPELPLATFLDTLAKRFYEETFCQKWWAGIVKAWGDDGIRMRCGTIFARGRTSWGARGVMNEKLRETENLYVALNIAGPFATKAEAEQAKV